ncbi:MAG: flavodoxin family protein [Firmicutes bacterium]|nr:flavodoxin family protein [Clostridiales bacterium]MBQ3122530.1 flavodoxin family protein [Bacillota bacterium]
MAKKVLVLAGSPRKGGNSDRLCDEFIKGALESGHEVEKIYVCDKKINFCTACRQCNAEPRCFVHDDDAQEIFEKFRDADVVAFGAPVYFYGINAQMKTLIDRAVAYNPHGWLDNKDFYYLITAGVPQAIAKDTTANTFHGFAVCLEGIVEKAVVYAAGVGAVGAIEGRPELKQAYEFGKNI